MSLLVADSPMTPLLHRAGSLHLTGAGPALWRVIDAGGRVIGHLQAFVDARGVRYRARRFHMATRAFRDLGDFWSADDAVDCLRFAR
jgi:hypothetical protein